SDRTSQCARSTLATSGRSFSAANRLARSLDERRCMCRPHSKKRPGLSSGTLLLSLSKPRQLGPNSPLNALQAKLCCVLNDAPLAELRREALLAAGRLHEHRRLGHLDDDVRVVVHPAIGDGYTLKHAGCGKGNDQCNYQHRCRDNDVTHLAPSPEPGHLGSTARSPPTHSVPARPICVCT